MNNAPHLQNVKVKAIKAIASYPRADLYRLIKAYYHNNMDDTDSSRSSKVAEEPEQGQDSPHAAGETNHRTESTSSLPSGECASPKDRLTAFACLLFMAVIIIVPFLVQRETEEERVDEYNKKCMQGKKERAEFCLENGCFNINCDIDLTHCNTSTVLSFCSDLQSCEEELSSTVCENIRFLEIYMCVDCETGKGRPDRQMERPLSSESYACGFYLFIRRSLSYNPQQ